MKIQTRKNRTKRYDREILLAVEAILKESLEEKDSRIRQLEDEIRSLRSVLADLHLDPRFWVGLPIGLTDDPCRCQPPKLDASDNQEEKNETANS